MLAIYKKELKTYFTSMMGCFFIALCLAVTSFYFCIVNLMYAYPTLYSSISQIIFIFIILMPVLTMRALSEEQRNKTDQLLYTSPVSVYGIVAGKYLAMLTVFAVPVLIMCFYPLIMAQYGTVHMPSAYLAILAYFLIGAAYMAVGLFISSITENQIIAAVVSFAVLLASYMLMDIIAGIVPSTAIASFIGFLIVIAVVCVIYYLLTRNVIVSAGAFILLAAVELVLYLVKPGIFEGAIIVLLSNLNLTMPASNLMVYGILDITSLVYYVTVILFFMFITVQSIQKKRWN